MAMKRLTGTRKLPSKGRMVAENADESTDVHSKTAKTRGGSSTCPTPKKQARKPRAKPPSFKNTRQKTLFDEDGYAPFAPSTDAHPVDGEPGSFDVSGMRITLHPNPKDMQFALDLTMDSMVVLHNSKGSRTYVRPMLPRPMRLDSWKCSKCTVSFRDKTDDGVIHATYGRPDHLELSIPHMLMWKKCGLQWLWHDEDCCARNTKNPTPWLGRRCDCVAKTGAD